MGAGIAQVAAAGGWDVRLRDVDEATARRALDGVRARFDRLVEKGQMTAAARDAASARLHAGAEAAAIASCDLLLEAIVEDQAAKVAALRPLVRDLPAGAVVASNTSSLSITALGEAIGCPRRFAGMHFFNPAPLMKLVEVVSGSRTDPAVVDRVAAIAEGWGKVVARAADVPGFIVNHVARPYYLEAFRILEEGYAAAPEIDSTMRELGGFKMGPLELTDLIGQDVNAATSRSVWEQLGRPALLRPSPIQEKLVAAGHLGRKTGRGVYVYKEDGAAPALQVTRRALDLPEPLRTAASAFAEAAGRRSATDLERYVFSRILVAVIAQAAWAEERGVAGARDIDLAMRFGANHPRGPLEWLASMGAGRCIQLLEALNATVDDGRFVVPGKMRTGA
jgi:3-hydroxybutyryl-CoA dehydrogenase